MKAIRTQAIVNSVRSKVDRSLSMTIHTPELTPQEKALFMELQGVISDMTLTPQEENVPTVEIDKDLKSKSQSERLRSVLYVYWKQQGENGEFSDFYRRNMERFIDIIKDKLDE